MTIGLPLIFSIISWTIRSPEISHRDNFYSIEVTINDTCSSKRDVNGTFTFQSLSNSEIKRCFFILKNSEPIICDNLTYGVQYNIDGFILCDRENTSLSVGKSIYELGEPRYLNSTSYQTSIHTLFYLPGLFYRLIIELSNINKTCTIEYSSTSSPFYRCLFVNLIPSQWYILTYYLLKDEIHQLSNGASIVYTELEDFNFSCEFNEERQRIDFNWNNLNASGYSNLTISILSEENKLLWIVSCYPYYWKNNCSTNQYLLKPGQQYFIVTKLKKTLPNYDGQKHGKCSIKTNLNQVPVDSIQHEFMSETTVKLTWLYQPFDLKVRLKNLETNTFEYPFEFKQNMALFTNVSYGSIYQIEFNISKLNWPSILQRTEYFIQTNIHPFFIEKIVRLSDNSLAVNLNRFSFSKLKIIYCLQEIYNGNLRICSSSNRFDQLLPATIYNLSIIIHRDSFRNIFTWKKQIVSQLVNTNPSPLQIRTWRTNENCAAELINNFSFSYSTECMFNRIRFDCNQLECGYRYQLHVVFNRTIINSLCSIYQCDIQFNNSNLTTILFQTPLEPVRNLRIINKSIKLRQIQVDYDQPYGYFDHLVLICDGLTLKQRSISINSTICTDLMSNEFYRIYVETKRTGWETVVSNIIQTQLSFISNNEDDESNKRTSIQSFILPMIVGIIILIILFILIGLFLIYRQCYRKKRREQDFQQITEFNNIVNQVNIYSNLKQVYLVDLEKQRMISKPIQIKHLPFEYKKLSENNFHNLSAEFYRLTKNAENISESNEYDYLHKDRYVDIRPYEHSRVKLIPINKTDPGYINANFICGLNNPHEYIACQGPLKTTVDDHWKMIWEQNVSIIVMLTCLVEEGIIKCEQYWPLELNSEEKFGNLSVCVLSFCDEIDYDLRLIQLKQNDEIHLVKHFAFKMWNDHDIPKDSKLLVRFVRLIRSQYQSNGYGPILVHCSAGVGRSGTFIALDYLLQQIDKLKSDEFVDIYGTVFNLRQCREKMVQNKRQYLFIYQCLKEEYERASGNDNYGLIIDNAV